MSKIKRMFLFVLVLFLIVFSTSVSNVNAYSPITLEDNEPAQVHRCYGLDAFGFPVVISNTTSNILKVTAYYYWGDYTFTHDEWSSDVYDGTAYTDNYSMGDHTEYHYGSSKISVYNRYPFTPPYIIPTNAIILCSNQADINISYPSGGYIEGVVTGRFNPPRIFPSRFDLFYGNSRY